MEETRKVEQRGEGVRWERILHRARNRGVSTAYSRAGMEAGAKAGAEAGVKAGAQWAIENSRVRRRIERGPNGEILGTIEERVPE